MMECNLFLENNCDCKFINFGMLRDHLEECHNMDLLGLEHIKRKFNTKMQCRVKMFSQVERKDLIIILNNWLSEIKNENNATPEMQKINRELEKRQKQFKKIRKQWEMIKNESSPQEFD